MFYLALDAGHSGDEEDTMDLHSAQETDRGMSPVAATKPQTEFQRRLEAAFTEGMERRDKQRAGGPEELPEVEREITMLQGAMQGVHQRLAELAVRLEPVLPPDTLNQLLKGGHVVAEVASGFEVNSATGMRLRTIQDEISEVEGVLSYLLSVRV